ncbi:hypothetical protein BDR26DRAFT_927293 [Obelidium mucronatum]|nr:hypothetical protein BDR26DRAFT_927293 [Obelidium mucronatum]
MSAKKPTKSPKPKAVSPLEKNAFDDVVPLFLSPRKRLLLGKWYKKTRVKPRSQYTGLAAMIKAKLALSVDSTKLKTRNVELSMLADEQCGDSDEDEEATTIETEALLADIQESDAATSGTHLNRYTKQIAGFLSRIADAQESLVKQNAAQIHRQNVATVSAAAIPFEEVELMKLSKGDQIKAAAQKKRVEKVLTSKQKGSGKKAPVVIEASDEEDSEGLGRGEDDDGEDDEDC